MAKTLDELRQDVYRHSLGPLYDHMELIAKALSTDIQVSISPAALGSSAAVVNAAINGAAEKFVRTVTVEIVTAAGERHVWLNELITVLVNKTSTSGVVASPNVAAGCVITNGVGEVTLEYTGTWAAADVAIITVSGDNPVRGVDLLAQGSVDSVDTLIA